MPARIRIGLSSWTDKSLLDSGKFYPPVARSAEGMLRYYASQFPDLVEVNSTYYALPSARNAVLWAARTPNDFVFDVKLFGLFTQHPAQSRSLPKDVLQELDAETRAKNRLYFGDVPSGLADSMMERYVAALQPLAQAGKLGAVLMQFPRWFYPGKRTTSHLEWLKERLGGYEAAVEFRNARWLNDANRESTLDMLRNLGMAYVCVDEPQGYDSSVPPLAVVTTPKLAYVRFHGRRSDTWEKKGATVQERFRYMYTDAELKEWVPRVEQLAGQVNEIHLLMNTNYEDHAVRNARQLRMLLETTME